MDLDVVHQDIASFATDWFKLVVTHERFSLATLQQSAYEALRDLAVGTFSILHHTPVTAMGLNLHAHFSCDSEDQWHAIGDKLAPKDAWKRVFDAHIGLRSIRMQIDPAGDTGARRLITVEPSQKFPPGVWIAINDHRESAPEQGGRGAAGFVDALRNEWSMSIESSRTAMNQLLEGL